MSQHPDAMPPSPLVILEMMNAHQRSAVLKAGVDLEVFTAIDEGYLTVEALSTRCNASTRGLRMLLDGLTILGLLTKDHAGYRLPRDSKAFLVKTSQAYLGGMTEFLLSPPLYDGFRHLTEAVRKGGTALDEQGTTADAHPEWVSFARAMVPMMIGPATWIANFLQQQGQAVNKVLDIAAGHGMFGVEIGKVFPEATIYALDWEPVLAVAKENARAASLEDRYETIVGSAFNENYGSEYDVILLANFLHHFDRETCVALLKNVHAALRLDGRVVTLEFIPNDDRISPASADFALIMLATTPAGDAYTFSELEEMFHLSGFGASEMYEVPNSKEHVMITSKSKR
ncbi:methyltransferase [Nitrospira sp. M1]